MSSSPVQHSYLSLFIIIIICTHAKLVIPKFGSQKLPFQLPTVEMRLQRLEKPLVCNILWPIAGICLAINKSVTDTSLRESPNCGKNVGSANVFCTDVHITFFSYKDEEGLAVWHQK